jgi:hypothetical protein
MIAYPIRTTASIDAAANKGNVFTPKVDLNTIRVNLNTQTQGNIIPSNNADLLKQRQ